jgi:hypothetical protein
VLHHAFDGYVTLMLVDDPLGDGEAQPGTAGIAAARRVGTVEAFEDAGEVLGRDTNTVVRDL